MRYLLLSLLLAFSGCAALQEGNAEKTEKKLLQAGFHAFPADTPARQRTLASLPPYTFQASTTRHLYRYADPSRRILYVGGPHEYETYNLLVTNSRSRRASNLAQMTSANWRATGPMVW